MEEKIIKTLGNRIKEIEDIIVLNNKIAEKIKMLDKKLESKTKDLKIKIT